MTTPFPSYTARPALLLVLTLIVPGAASGQSRVVHDIRTVITVEMLTLLRSVRPADGQNRSWRAQASDRETRTVTVPANATLDVRNVSGSVTVTPGRGSDVTMEITRVARASDERRAQLVLSRTPVRVSERGRRLVVDAPASADEGSITTRFEISAPAGTNVSVITISGNITISDLTGNVFAETASGDIEIRNATNLTAAKTLSGAIAIEGVRSESDLDVSSVSGTTALRSVRGRHLKLSTISGSVSGVDLDFGGGSVSTLSGEVRYSGALRAGGEYEFHTHSGNLTIALDPAVGFTLEGRTFSGELSLAPALGGATANRRRRSLDVTVGDGRASVEVTSFSGRVTIGRK